MKYKILLGLGLMTLMMVGVYATISPMFGDPSIISPTFTARQQWKNVLSAEYPNVEWKETLLGEKTGDRDFIIALIEAGSRLDAELAQAQAILEIKKDWEPRRSCGGSGGGVQTVEPKEEIIEEVIEDLNVDGFTNNIDVQIIRLNWGESCHDLTSDGIVDDSDLSVVLANIDDSEVNPDDLAVVLQGGFDC